MKQLRDCAIITRRRGGGGRGGGKLGKYAPKPRHTLPLIKQKLINPKRATEQEKGIFFKLTFIIAYPVNFAFELLKRSVFFSPNSTWTTMC